jgi:hypothetical protein
VPIEKFLVGGTTSPLTMTSLIPQHRSEARQRARPDAHDARAITATRQPPRRTSAYPERRRRDARRKRG